MEKPEASATVVVCTKIGHEITKSLGATFENSGMTNETTGRSETEMRCLSFEKKPWKSEVTLNFNDLLMIYMFFLVLRLEKGDE